MSAISIDLARPSAGQWVADAKPLLPHACDDWFDGAAIDAKWSEFDHDNLVTWSIDTARKCLKGVATGGTGAAIAAQLQAAPASEYAIYTRIHGVGVAGAQSVNGGIMLTAGTGSGDAIRMLYTRKFWALTALAEQGSAWLAGTDYNSFTGATTVPGAIHATYLRLRVNGSTYWCDVSVDGKEWGQGLTGAIGFTPTNIGLGYAPGAAGTTALYSLFKVFSGSGASAIDANHLGRVL